jgi:hypothetical protein
MIDVCPAGGLCGARIRKRGLSKESREYPWTVHRWEEWKLQAKTVANEVIAQVMFNVELNDEKGIEEQSTTPDTAISMHPASHPGMWEGGP